MKTVCRSKREQIRKANPLLGLLFVWMLSGCGHGERQEAGSGKNASDSTPKVVSATKQWTPMDGVLVLKPGYQDAPISIYNDDGSVWRRFSLTDEFHDDSIRPFGMKPESIVLVLRGVRMSDDGYTVIVNEGKQLQKIVKRWDTNFVYQPWAEHILTLFAVGFDRSANSIRRSPSEKSGIIAFQKGMAYHPVKCHERWLMIRDDNGKTGWIKWKDERGELIITPFYEA